MGSPSMLSHRYDAAMVAARHNMRFSNLAEENIAV